MSAEDVLLVRALSLLVPALAHLRPSSLPMLERLDQLHVEEGDEQQRSAVDDDEVEDVGVDDAVQDVGVDDAVRDVA